MPATPLHYQTLLEVSSKLQRGEITSVEVTEAILTRIAQHDGALKSYETVLADRAMTKAREADAELQRGFWRGPLHGVPIAVKDLCNTDFAPTAAGMFIHKGNVPATTSTVVARLEQAGAILLGKLCMTEGAFATHHPKMPTPVNPWNSEVWTGASSSGSGAATAAGLCYASLGSDTGGSIRFPSAGCGLTGMKATWGRVSRYGICHLSESLDHVGPMTRTAADCAAVLGVIAGADDHDPTSLLAPVPDYLAGLGGGIRGLRVGIAEEYAFEAADAETRAALMAAKDALAELGARFVSIVFPPLEDVATAWGQLCMVETAIAHEATFPSRAAEYGPSFAGFIEEGRKVSAMDLGKAQILRGKFKGHIEALFQDIDVLLIPVMKTVTPGATEWVDMVNSGDLAPILRFTSEFNFTGQPAITLNGGFDTRGAPIGFQFVGKHLSEAMLLRAAHAFQSITDFHSRHPAIA